MAGTPGAPAKKAGAKGKVQAKRSTDKEAVERDYRTGRFTDRELGAKYGVSHTSIQKWAKAGLWQKDMAGAIKQATEAKLAEKELKQAGNAEVATQVAKQVAKAMPATMAVVSALAELRSEVQFRQNQDLRVLRDVAMGMLSELVVMGDNAETIQDLAMAVMPPENPQAEAALRRQLNAALSLPGRVDTWKKIMDGLAKGIEVERKSHGLDTLPPGGDTGRTSIPIRFVEAKVVREVGDDD